MEVSRYCDPRYGPCGSLSVEFSVEFSIELSVELTVGREEEHQGFESWVVGTVLKLGGEVAALWV